MSPAIPGLQKACKMNTSFKSGPKQLLFLPGAADEPLKSDQIMSKTSNLRQELTPAKSFPILESHPEISDGSGMPTWILDPPPASLYPLDMTPFPSTYLEGSIAASSRRSSGKFALPGTENAIGDPTVLFDFHWRTRALSEQPCHSIAGAPAGTLCLLTRLLRYRRLTDCATRFDHSAFHQGD